VYTQEPANRRGTAHRIQQDPEKHKTKQNKKYLGREKNKQTNKQEKDDILFDRYPAFYPTDTHPKKK
jgi:hypothetical protein